MKNVFFIFIICLAILKLATCQSEKIEVVDEIQILDEILTNDKEHAIIRLLTPNEIDSSTIVDKSIKIKNRYPDYENVKVYYYEENDDRLRGAWAVASFDRKNKDGVYNYYNRDLVELDVSLPQIDVDINQSDTVSPHFEIYVGGSPSKPDVVSITLNQEKSISYFELREAIRSVKERFTLFERPRISAKLHIDKDLPYIYLHYLESCLENSGVSIIQYTYNESNMSYTRMLERYSEYCKFGEDKSIISAVNTENYLYRESDLGLISENLDANWNPKKYTCQYEAVISEEDLFKVKIDSLGQIYINSVEVSQGEVKSILNSLLEERENTNRLYFVFYTSPYTRYGDFLTLYLCLRNTFHEVRDRYTRDEYGKNFSECDKTVRKRVLSKYPLGLSFEID